MKYPSKHGMFGTKEYNTWASMIQRCTNPKSSHWSMYGGRGITVCDRWFKFENFLKDMGRKPSPSHQIERINNSLGYSPGNCRWATFREQMHNTRNNVNITIGTETMCIAEWGRRVGIKGSTIATRIRNYGWSPVEAVLTPLVWRGVK